MFHISNKIFTGYISKTKIGNNNKFLAESHIGHDTTIHNNVTTYPRVITGGHSTLLDYSTMGMYSCIQQNSVLGSFSMIGMGNAVSHNVFPFYIYLDKKYLRFNKVKIPEELQIDTYSSELINLIEKLKKNNCDKEIVKQYDLPENIKYYIYKFLDVLKNNKI